jgi:LPXTG-motif cell wall-anchored protein
MAVLGAVAFAGMVGLGSQPVGAGGFTCSYTVSPTTLGPDGGTVTVTGLAPGSSVVRVFADQQLVAVVNSDVDGNFFAQFDVTESVEIAVGVDDYPVTPCVGVGNNTAGATPGGVSTGRGNLPRTGSSNTGQYVLVGLACLAAGAVLVAAGRRWNTIRGR